MNKPFSSFAVLRFVFLLCLLSAFLLASVSTLLAKKQEQAKTLDRNRQLLIASNLLTPSGKLLDTEQTPSIEKIQTLSNLWIHPRLVDNKGNLFTFEEKHMLLETYLEKHQKTGFAKLPLKLIYLISKDPNKDIKGYVIPINGYGLWSPIFGYLALQADGKTVRGISWYEQAETAGLGANIASASWQKQFQGKKIFLSSNEPESFEGYLGLIVVKGSVAQAYPASSAKIQQSVDGITGATLTGDGVTRAYQSTLQHYRPFLERVWGKAS